ncbi:MAG: hypothetical protein EP318_13905 [Rhodobacteraceae bacterium]|nr:MAG: hypothetical protein EP318_13905 [Paracoccaceae bacterium]
MLEPRPARYKISDGDDAWGLVITRTAIDGVQVWYAAHKGLLTLGLTTPGTRALVPDGDVPEGAECEVSKTGWRMYRWPAPVMALDLPPEDQPGADHLVAQIRGAFDWFNAVRRDLAR